MMQQVKIAHNPPSSFLFSIIAPPSLTDAHMLLVSLVFTKGES